MGACVVRGVCSTITLVIYMTSTGGIKIQLSATITENA